MYKSSIVRFSVLIWLCLLAACHKTADIPDPGSPRYRDLVSAFYVGLAGLQAGEDVRAKEGLTRAAELAPGEPASWANLGLLELRQQQFDQAFKDAETARTLAPQDSHVEVLLGLIEDKRGNLAEAIRHLRQAVKLDRGNLQALYALAQEIERQGSATSDRESRDLLGIILQAQPNNQAVLLDTIRLSSKLGDSRGVAVSLTRLQEISVAWPERALRQLEAIKTASTNNVHAASVPAQFLRNVLVREVSFRRDMDAVRSPAGTIGAPFQRFLRIPSPSSLSSPSDLTVQFVPKNTSDLTLAKDVVWASSFVLDAKSDPRVIWADRSYLHLDQGTTLALPGNNSLPFGRNAIAFGDLNYDFKTDIVMANAGGLRIYQQGLAPLFADVTAKTKLDSQIINGSYTGAWLFDIDLDGDLDIVLGTPNGSPLVLRNNGDGSFAAMRPFTGVDGVKDFAATDIDGDGDPDIAMIDGRGKLKVFSNERLGNYRLRPAEAAASLQLLSTATGDINGDGLMDFVVLASDGRVLRISDWQSGAGMEVAGLARASISEAAAANLFLADMDNNGSLDLVVRNQVFLQDRTGFSQLSKPIDGDCQTITDLNSDGRLDIITLGRSKTVEQLINQGAKQYKWQILRTRASQTTGDQRINSFGIGGEVEVRSGLLTQKQNITAPVLHFGLGENSEVSLARIVWPNGQLQVEFDLKPDATALAQQRLKGSCPFLFAWDGKRMRFVKDCPPWSPALGLHVNAQKVAGIGQTQEWFKVPGEQVQAQNGFYDLRITAEYWETFYIDHYSFLAVDHPPDTEVFTDERFAVPSPPLRLYAMRKTRPFATARDDSGNDVSQTLQSIDGRYLDNFGRGRYQGVTRDHWVELELPSAAPRSGSLYLIGSGWLHPTDATINVALGQGSAAPPQGMSLEVQGVDGKWRVKKTGLGFPAGRIKNVVLDLAGLFETEVPRRLRLRTNLEIYWDKLAWAPGIDENRFRVQHLNLASATLQYRGFSKISQANSSSPELPDYDAIAERGPRWRDLEGYYTRYGDVRPLLEKIDDRMLITNAGDELRLKVSAPSAPPEGWTRDLIMIGDGWIKDGDFNTTFSKAVLPLPYHGLKEYTIDSSTLEDDPAYKLHPDDWNIFHTRYVSPDLFTGALWH